MLIIIGGSGFIGTRLCKRIIANNGEQFRILDKKKNTNFPEQTILVNVANFFELNNAIPDGATIVNLAAEHLDNVVPTSLYYEVNVGGASNICNVAREKKVNKIIFVSSVAVYGFAPFGTNELGKIDPFNDYGRSKWQAEEIYRAWQAEDCENRSLVIVRPTVVFGEGNRGNVYNLLN